jgi:endonuclease-8
VPEGDTIFRTARALGRALTGKPVTGFTSMYALLTRFNDDTPLIGQTVEHVESRGKWVLMGFSGGATLATHMLMNGSWHIYRPGERWQRPRSEMRILLETADFVAVGFLVPVAKMLKPRELERAFRIPDHSIDILNADFDEAAAIGRIRARADEEIGNVLLHQGVTAGVGNVFKSEICFVTGTNPFCLVRDLDEARFALMVSTARQLVKANVLEDSGNLIVTYGGKKRRTTGAADPGENLWVYARAGEPCRRCGTKIERRLQGMGARSTYWCPHCQPFV